MRVAVVEFAARGGLIHYAFQLCRALAASGAEVTLITGRHYELERLPHPFRLEKLLRLWDPKARQPHSLSRWLLLRHLRRIGRAVRYYREWLRLILRLRRERPDLVQLGDIRFPTDLPCLLVLRFLRLKLTCICHNIYPFATRGGSAGLPRRSRFIRFLYGGIYRQFERIFVHFEVNRREFLDAFGLDPARVISIPHGNEEIFLELADPGVDSGRVREELNLAVGDRVILFLGTLSRYKGTELLLEAFARVRQVERRSRLVLAGFPLVDFDLNRHQALAQRLGIGDYVRFVPRYVESEAVAAWMGLAEVAVFPHRVVYQSGALQVAQTFGVPIVATSVGATPEVLVHEKSGLLVPAGEAGALADAILKLLGDRELARRLARRAGEEARSRFGWQAIAATVLDQYRTILASDDRNWQDSAIRMEGETR